MEKYLPLGVTLLTIISNALGGNIKEISNKYKIESNITITPAGFTFSIWGLIYSLLIYVTFTHYSKFLYTQTPFGSIFTLFVISAVLNALWIQTWGKNLELSSVILILLAIVLMTITVELNKAGVDKLLIYTFGIYTAWTIIASLVNLSTLLVNKKILDNKTIKLMLVGILTILPFLLKYVFKSFLGASIIPMLLTFIWASLGIILNGNNNLIFIAPIASSLLNIIMTFVH
jgi:tryptophan-rich sensory protein